MTTASSQGQIRTDGPTSPWYRQPRGQVWKMLAGAIDKLGRDQDGRMMRMVQHLRLYSDRRLYPVHLGSAIRTAMGKQGGRMRPPLSLNVVRNIVDAATSKLCESRPAASVTPREGDYSLQRKAREQQYFVDGLYENERIYPERQRGIKNATLLGSGAIKIVEWEDRVGYENTFPGELWIDDYDGLYGRPNCLYQNKLWDRDELLEKFSSKTEMVKRAEQAGQNYFGRMPGTDQVLVTEAWKRGPKGRHVISISSGDLRDEEWTTPFPFGFWHWSEEPLGFWGTGLGQILMGIQLELNAVLQTIQANVYQGSNLVIWAPPGSGIEDSHINNDLRARILRTPGEPKWLVHDVFSPQLIGHITLLLEQAYQVSGMSQLSAAGQIPAGLAGSGRAQLVYNNIESQRFMTFGRQDEDTMCQIAYRSFEAAQRIVERGGKLQVRAKQKNWLVDLNVDKELLDTSDTQITMSASSLVPKTLAGKMAMAEKYIEMGVDRSTTFKLTGLGDIGAEENLERAPRELIDETIERILEKGEYYAPVPIMDLQLAKEVGTLAWQRARLRGFPQENLDKLLQWVQACIDLMQPVDAGAGATPPPGNDNALPPGGEPLGLPPGPGLPGEPVPPVPVPQGVPAEVVAA